MSTTGGMMHKAVRKMAIMALVLTVAGECHPCMQPVPALPTWTGRAPWCSSSLHETSNALLPPAHSPCTTCPIASLHGGRLMLQFCHRFSLLVVPHFDLKRLHHEPHQHWQVGQCRCCSSRLLVVLFALKLSVVIVKGVIHCC